MVDGTPEMLEQAADMIRSRPHPDHIEEGRIMFGRKPEMTEMLDRCLRASALVACDVWNEEAIIGGVTLDGILKHQIWLLTTATATETRRGRVWLARRGKRMLLAADRYLGWPRGYIQAIPKKYVGGVNYARHMGFVETGTMKAENCPSETLVVMERMVPR